MIMNLRLPGAASIRVIAECRRIAELAPDFVRIYPTVVLAGSPLEKWYREGMYEPLALDAAVEGIRAWVAGGVPTAQNRVNRRVRPVGEPSCPGERRDPGPKVREEVE